MPITEEQREQRKTRLGSSDIAALLGVDHFSTAYDVYLEKTGKLEPEKKDVKKYLEAGNIFEGGVLDEAERLLGRLDRGIDNQGLTVMADLPVPVGSIIDARVLEPSNGDASVGDPVEAKTAGLFGPLVEEWGEDGTDEVPDRIIIQDHVHMLCTGAKVCHTPTFLGGRGFVMFRVKRDEEVIETIKKAAIEFWNEHVLADVEPKGVLPNIELIARIRREPESIVDVPDELVQTWLDTTAERLAAEKADKAAKKELLAALGIAEAGKCSLGLATYLSQSRSGIDSKKLKEEKPEIASKYATLSTFRVLRFKKMKVEK